MDHDIMKLWVNNLRSGVYPQTQHVLKDNDGYCCLGVLCDLWARDHGFWNEDENENYTIGVSEEHEVLPAEVMEWAEMKTPGGTLNKDDCLASLNDKGYTFSRLADVIEKNWEVL